MILLSAGHHPLAKGATYNTHNEHDEAVLWVDKIASIIKDQLEVVVVPTGPLTILDPKTKKVIGGKIYWINAQRNIHLACELHFNSDVSKRQKGSETLYCPGSLIGQAMAELVQNALGGLFPPSRGAKAGWHQQDFPGRVDYPGDIDGDEHKNAFLDDTRCPAIILEPEFIYNWDVLQERRDAACAMIADVLIDCATSLAGVTP